VFSVIGDRYAGLWPRERFQMHSVSYIASAKPKSDLYRDFLPAVNGRRIELLDHSKLVAQLCALERRTWRGGRDSIDHPPNQHDDVVNCVAGALTNLIGAVEQTPPHFGWQTTTGSGFNGSHWIGRDAWRNGVPGLPENAAYGSSPDEFRRMLSDLGEK
jgi:hypothetical protein